MVKLNPFSILGGESGVSSAHTLMALLGSLSFALRVIVELVRVKHKRKSGASGACPCCGRLAAPAKVVAQQ